MICLSAGVVTVDALAHLTYQRYACDRQLCSMLSNNYNDLCSDIDACAFILEYF